MLDIDQVKKVISESTSFAEATRKLGKKGYSTLKRKVIKFKIDTSHFKHPKIVDVISKECPASIDQLYVKK